ncbi:MAG: ribosome biogenesis GTPase Der [Alphaproteobacteria bacterium]|nr:ribosome biogenesis GTPase Der [Alphaproteobacteria bacterium]
MPLTVAIVGRPNVGKSTLFNRLAGKKLALVHDTPGVTRDRREALAGGLKLIDTAGFEEGLEGSLARRMTAQTMAAIAEAEVCLFVIDARDGITAGDEIIAETLRRSGKPVILAANKSEGRGAADTVADAYRLGFGEALTVSAEHNLGIAELIEALGAPETEDAGEESEDEAAEIDDTDGEAADDSAGEDGPAQYIPDRPMHLAIVGRPNVGKSSLFNHILGAERSLTGPEPGLTRDAIAAPWEAHGRAILLHDTAGLRKSARAAGHALEQLSVGSTLDAIRFADCVIVVIDATQPFEKQDLTIADLIEKEGRAVVFAVNKWDVIENRGGAIGKLRLKLDESLPQLKGAPLIAISARTGEGIDRLLPAVLEADRAWNKHVPTSALNRFLEEALSRHAPPAIRGRRVRIRYMTQPKVRPPTFALFGNQLAALPDDYLRYLTNNLRDAFDLAGTPIRLRLRGGNNPYAE